MTKRAIIKANLRYADQYATWKWTGKEADRLELERLASGIQRLERRIERLVKLGWLGYSSAKAR